MNTTNANPEERTDREFTATGESLISDLVERANTAVREDRLPPHDVATILRATADCVDEPVPPTEQTVRREIRTRFASMGSYLPAWIAGGGR